MADINDLPDEGTDAILDYIKYVSDVLGNYETEQGDYTYDYYWVDSSPASALSVDFVNEVIELTFGVFNY